MAELKGQKGLLKDVLAWLKPDERKVRKEVDTILKKLNSALKKNRVMAKAVAGGSIAKGTFLKGDYDCDIFVKFNKNAYSNKDISKILEGVLKKTFKNIIRVHGSRDYFQIKDAKNNFRYEIVPVLDIKSTKDAVNVTDCSPLHVRWVNKFPKMKNEIRLTKAFMKACGVYGAESYIKGFSGHVVDILTIYYNGFLNLLKAASQWKGKEVIDYYNYHKGKALFNLNKSKIQSPIIVIDPIQPDRNAAAALDYERFDIFRKKALEFLKKPSKEFFMQKELNISDLRKLANEKDGKLIVIDVTAKNGKEDVVGAKLLKAFEFLIMKLEENGFGVKAKGWGWDKNKKAIFWIIVDKKDLEKTTIRQGPPLHIKKHAEKFKKMHKKVFEKNGRLYAEVEREFTNAEEMIKYLINQNYILERVRGISLKNLE